MTVSSGFFNSVNHDRLYDAEQVSSIFDGIIEDGVYESIGEAFMVSPYADGNDTVIVGTGRAWFDHTWTLNDAQFSITLSPPNTLLGRIDTIVIDVDRRDSVRKNSIIVVSGTPSDSPTAPALLNEELHKQYPIADIRIDAGVSGVISASKITYRVGTPACPLVTGPLEALNITNYVAQMEATFEEWHDDVKTEWDTWYQGVKDVFDDLTEGKINLTTSVDDVTIEFTEQKLRVKDRGITQSKLSFELQSAIGILDPSTWGYDEYYEFIQTIPSTGQEETFVSTYVTQAVLQTWTYANVEQFYTALKSDTSKNTVYSRIPWGAYKLSGLRHLVEFFGSSHYSEAIGRTVSINLGQYGNHDFRIIGVNHDTLADGGTALLTLDCVDIVTVVTLGGWGELDSFAARLQYSESPLKAPMSALYSSFESDARSVMKQAKVLERYDNATVSDHDNDPLYAKSFNDYVWPLTRYEMDERLYNPFYPQGGVSLYDWWSANYNSGDARRNAGIKKYNGSPHIWMLRDNQSYDSWYVVDVDGDDVGAEVANLHIQTAQIGLSPVICC